MKQVHFRTFHSSCATVFHCHSSVFLIKIRNWCVPMSHGTPKFLYLGKACRTSIFFIQVKGWGLTWKFKWGEVKLDAALGDVHTSKPYRNLKKKIKSDACPKVQQSPRLLVPQTIMLGDITKLGLHLEAIILHFHPVWTNSLHWFLCNSGDETV